MDDVARLNPSDRSDLFRAAADHCGLTVGVIEKDFWVCWVLRRLYTLQPPVQIHFKGGTSLSKVFHVIARMSEDVDLVIDRNSLGFTGDKDPTATGLSNKKRRQLVEEIKLAARQFVHDSLKPALDSVFAAALGTPPGPTKWHTAFDPDDRDDQTILFRYPTLESPSQYLRAMVRLEFGARGDPWPSVAGTIRPYAADELPEHFSDADTDLPFVVTAERTFWEKATILHMLYHKHQADPLGSRVARHYYDTLSLAHHELGQRALADLSLFARVVEHKKLFFPSAWAQYDLARPGGLRLVPPNERLAELRTDYTQMAEEMMFDEPPAFDVLIDELQSVEQTINRSASDQ